MNASTRVGAPKYAHLAAMTDGTALFEHARFDTPRKEHGYCVDDVARGLIVTIREPDQTPLLAHLSDTYLRFLDSALDSKGRSRNRMDQAGNWTDSAALGDWWGRSVWALGTAAIHAPLPTTRDSAMRGFSRACHQRSPHLRAMAFATIGASEVLMSRPDDVGARRLVQAAVDMFPIGREARWPWPEPRLRYGNGSVVEALIVAGSALHNERVTTFGLELLEFLLRIETAGGHFSVTGAAGRGSDEAGPQFAQQPIEVAALADAAARAFDVTGDPGWLIGVEMAWAWFEGHNDCDTVMFDAGTGAGFDGLEREGRNENQGAESTLAALSTYQQARRFNRIGVRS